MSNIYEKQFSVGEILSESWKYFRDNFQLIFIITVIVYIPINILLSFIPVEETMESFWDYLHFIQILEGFIGVIAIMAITYAIKKIIDGENIDVGTAFKESISRWGAVIGTNIMAGILLVLLTLLLIVPGIIYGIYWMFVMQIVVLENKSGKAAMDHSKEIVKGRWWKVFWYSMVLGLLGGLIALALGIPYGFLPESIITSIIYDTFIDVVFSFFIVVSTVFYINFNANKQVAKIKTENNNQIKE